jgi:hydrogenase maturation protease
MSALVAGVGNPLFGDDGFGIEVVHRLATGTLPPRTRLVDVGTGTLHLVFELMAAPAMLLIADATARGGEPGTLYVIEPEDAPRALALRTPSPHGMDLVELFGVVEQLGVARPRTWIVGCEPAALNEPMRLSPAVRSAIPSALETIHRILRTGVEHGH